MIARYSLPEMERIWEIRNRYQCWLDVELAAARAMSEMGIIPKEDYEIIEQKADFDPDRIDEIEAVTRHDVIAFLTNVAEYVGPSSRWVHFGMTSSDVLDTATALQLKQAGELVLSELLRMSEVLKLKARKYRHTICMGRSHGIHAEPTSFGLKFALWYDETQRNIRRLEDAIEAVSIGQISGAVGNYAHLSPEVEERTCEYLGLKPVNVSTQVIQRDRHAQYLITLAQIGSTMEKIAVEIRHLQRTEVGEAEENFTRGQKGSSAMPHKRNPILTEQLSGLARVLRANAQAGLENNALWHERDISHSSVERIILPDSSILTHYMLVKCTDMLDKLIVYPERMIENIEITGGIVFSQAILLNLANVGMSREQAYSIVQEAAMKSITEHLDFKELIINNEELISALGKEEIEAIFSYDRYLQNVDHILKRCGII